MGPLRDVMEKLPMFGDMIPEGANLDDSELVRTKAMVSSMTKDERRDIELFRKHPSRLTRVAKGSGRTPKEVADLLQRFAFMRQMMGSVGQQAGMLGRIPGMKQLAMARNLRSAVRTGGLEGNPMMAGLAEELLQAAVADQGGGFGGFGGFGGMGMPGGGGGGTRRAVDKDKKKALRKQQKQARKKSRR
jgi:signal recognition particle subunit SRP54